MVKHLKHLLYLTIVVILIFLYWFIPKYSYIAKNPGFCVNLTKNLYYCGSNANMDKLFDIQK